MFKVLFLLGLPVMLLSAAPAARYPDGYWERGYSSGQINSVQYNIKIKVEDVDKAQSEVQRIMTEAGATLSGNSWNNYGNGRQDTSISYQIDAKKADQAAKKLFVIGDLQSYNAYRQIEKTALPEIEKKIEELTVEISGNQAALKKMPIADYFLNAQLKRLKQSRDAITAGLGRAVLNIGLVGADKDK